MTSEVIFETHAIEQASKFLDDDAVGLRQVLDAVDKLLADPRPPMSSALGSPDLRRLRVGRYRMLYEIKANSISITHIARTSPRR